MARCVRIAVGVAVLAVSSAHVGPGFAQSLPRFAARIANGLETFDFSSTVALLQFPDGSPAFGFPVCTGVLIGCSTVLTAAHCVCTDTGARCQTDGPALGNPMNLAVAMQNGPTVGVRGIHVPVDYARGQRADVAILKLSEPVNGIRPTPINAATAVTFGTPGTIAGYGVSDETLNDNGIKRRGAVVTAACPTGVPDQAHVCWTYPGTDAAGPPGTESNICPGDSGAPLFIDFGDGPRVAGVTSGGLGACHTADRAFDTDIFVNRAFIQTVAGADLNNAGCGPLPQAGERGAAVMPFSGAVDDPADSNQTGDSGAASGRHSFSVPAGTQVLRVVLNAEEGPLTGRNDFDLFVKFGAAPSATDFDCTPNFVGGNFEGCEFSAPRPGEWHALVVRSQGPGGRYQLSATLFGTDTIHIDDFERR